MEFNFDNYSLFIGKQGKYNYYKWKVFMDESADTLAQVKRVEYRLHSTFRDPIRIVEDRISRFALQSEGWGEFYIFITVYLNDGKKENTKYYLKLTKPQGDLVLNPISDV
jgi:transcription initiation factor IIF auxiliary subunit